MRLNCVMRTLYNNVWKNHFGNNFINLGIRGDRVENILWRFTAFAPRLKNVILCGTNNEDKVLFSIVSSFANRFNNPTTSICGFLPRNECFSINRVIVDEINELFRFRCSVNNFHFKDQSGGLTLNNGTLDFSQFHSDDLHLVEKGNLELG